MFSGHFRIINSRVVAHIKGSLTIKGYRVATVFIEHFSDLSFVFPKEDNTSAELIRAKMGFQKFANSFGVNVLYHHVDDGRFADNSLKELAVLGDEKQESTNIMFKTGANSASPNANLLEESNAKRRTQQDNNAAKRQKD